MRLRRSQASTRPSVKAPVVMHWRSRITLSLVGVLAFTVFCWPLVITPTSSLAGYADVPLLFAALLPFVILVAVAELADGGLDAKAIAMLGVLTALGAALRPLGTGIAGIEPIFFLLVLAGRALGPGFGFLLGCLTLLTSALVTGGVGPWLPYQMLAAAGVSAGAGMLPQVRGRAEILLLVAYSLAAGIAYGLAMNLSFWPFMLGSETALSFVAGAPVAENLRRFLLFSGATSLAFDIPRAVLMATLVALAGPGMLTTLRRASRRAAFHATAHFDASGDRVE